MKKLILLLSLLTACTCTEVDTTDNNKKLKANLAEEPQTLDPRVTRTTRDLSLAMQLFEGLTRLDKDGTPMPAVAEKIEISSDGLTYLFHLRDCKWTNGESVSAEDFVTSWKTVLDPNFATDYAHMLYPIKNAAQAKTGKCSLADVGVHALDAKTLQVTLNNPTPYFLELTAFPTFFAVKQKDSKQELISNGPFSLAEWRPSEMVVLKKNPLYWDQKEVALEEIVFSIIPDNTTESYLYEKGELDWLGQPLSNNLSCELLTKLKKDGKVSSYPVAGTYWLKYNTKKAPFDDARVRQAFSFAIDRGQIKEHILQGNQQIATGILPPSMSIKEKDLFADNNKSLALVLFNSYLIDHPHPKITISFKATERNKKIMQYIADSWHTTFGLEIALEAVEPKVYSQKVKMGEFQVGSGDWIADFNDPLSFLELFKFKNETATGMNDTGWSSQAFTELLTQATSELDPTKRKALLADAERILVEEMVVAPLYHYSYDYSKNEKVKDVVLSPLGPVDFKRAKKI